VLLEIGTDQEEAAATLGAGPGRLLAGHPSLDPSGARLRVTLTTARVLGEFGAVVVVSGNITGKTQTMTLFISNSVEN